MYKIARSARAGGLLASRVDERVDWKTSRGQKHFVLASCVPWNLVAEVARRLSGEEASAREAAAKARQAAERAAQRGQDAGADEVAEKKAQSSAARWAAIRADMASEVRFKKIPPRLCAGPLTTGPVQIQAQYLPSSDGEGFGLPWLSAGVEM